MRMNGVTLSSLRAAAKEQVDVARSGLSSLQGQASKALERLASEGRSARVSWKRRLQQLTSTGTLDPAKWQARFLDAMGAASTLQVRRIRRELTHLARKINALSTDKTK
jgi:hypothetical protein